MPLAGQGTDEIVLRDAVQNLQLVAIVGHVVVCDDLAAVAGAFIDCRAVVGPASQLLSVKEAQVHLQCVVVWVVLRAKAFRKLLVIQKAWHLLAADVDLGVPLASLLEQRDSAQAAGLGAALACLAPQHGHQLRLGHSCTGAGEMLILCCSR